MKKSRLLMITVVLLLVSGLAVHAEYRVESDEGEICAPVQTMILTPPEDVEAKFADVRFPHADHFSYSCMECHHMWDGYSDINACMDCHDATEYISRKEAKEDYIMYYQSAYHALCRDCHAEIGRKNTDIKKENKGKSDKDKVALLPNGPKSCNGCHSVKAE
ncbi:cytochrome c3 family protein [Desulfatibacillum aliphaticivorans]|uniref:cytochrome c3 family protein n=1 Tax=Desulfatibacillum aliphaticivorans TaxID=218208 RepID=UPI0003F83B77|nr:cytochrome c3 family protein [Desulfatibacillum aliphaticivorans]